MNKNCGSFNKITDGCKEKKGPFFGVRHLQSLLLFLGLAAGYSMRANLFSGIVAMTDKSGNPNFKEYNWSEQSKSYILSSFFWGYWITQIPGGHWTVQFGAKRVFLISIIISTVGCFLTPLCVGLDNLSLLCLLRTIQGLSQGVLFPCTHAILSKWSPIEERGALCSISYSGTFFGVVVVFGISGEVATSPMGWPGIFYICGALSVAWIAAWIIWGANSPDDYVGISLEEKLMIRNSLQGNSEEKYTKNSTKIPWTKICSSGPVLVLLLVHCAHNYGFIVLLIELPTYMNRVLGTDIKSNALLSSLPYLAMLLLSFLFSGLSSILAKHRFVSINFNRKLLNTIGQWFPAVTLLALAFCIRNSEQINLAILLLVLTVGVNSASFSGFQVNHIDLSPNYGAVLMGITNCAANIISVVAPLSVGFIVTDETNPDQWRIVFLIASGIYFVGNSLFLLFGKTKVQPFNDVRNEKDGALGVELENLKV